jgi:hypothetical protein
LLLLYDARAPRTCSFLPAFNFLLSRQELDFHLCFAASFFRCTVSLTISFSSPLWIFSLFFLGGGVGGGGAGGLVCVFSIAVLCTTLSVAFGVFQCGRSRVVVVAVVVVVFVVVVLLVIVVSICFRTTDQHSIVNNNTQFVVLRVVFCFVLFFPLVAFW